MVVLKDEALRLRKHISGLKQPLWDVGPKRILPESPSCILLGLDPELAKTCQGLRPWFSRLLGKPEKSVVTAQELSEGDKETPPKMDTRIRVSNGAATREINDQLGHITDVSLMVPFTAHTASTSTIATHTSAEAIVEVSNREHDPVESSSSRELLMSGALPLSEIRCLQISTGSQANDSNTISGG
jgi:hypothetical protein